MKLGFYQILTIIFVLLRAFGVVDWSWWVVFYPIIILVALIFVNAILQYFDR